ncbi:MAG: acetyltransferase [Planctomycetota bacterium]
MIQPARNHPPLVIYGAGDHGLVVADAARAAGTHVLGFLDDAPHPAGRDLLDPDHPTVAAAEFIVAIGDNAARLKVLCHLREQGRSLINVVHPDATVSTEVQLGRGIYVGPRAVVGPAVELGDAVIINSASVVEHHDRLAAGVHVAPGAALAGRVGVGESTLVGLGARVLPGLKLGKRCIVGAGAVVTRDVPDHTTVRGIPAKAEG